MGKSLSQNQFAMVVEITDIINKYAEVLTGDEILEVVAGQYLALYSKKAVAEGHVNVRSNEKLPSKGMRNTTK